MSDQSPAYRIGVISDTHGKLANKALEIFEGVDLILHAGDIGHEDVITALETIAPVTAVYGNTDTQFATNLRPWGQQLETPAGRIALTHGHMPGAPTSNHRKMVSYFQAFKPDIIIFGHSHIPCLEKIEDVILFNPGAASLSRWGRGNTVGLITLPAPGEDLILEHLLIG